MRLWFCTRCATLTETSRSSFLFTLMAHLLECRVPDLPHRRRMIHSNVGCFRSVLRLEWTLTSNQRALCYLHPFSVVDCLRGGSRIRRRLVAASRPLRFGNECRLVVTFPKSWERVLQEGPKSA